MNKDQPYLLDYGENIKLVLKQKLSYKHKKLPALGLNICYSVSSTYARRCLKNIENKGIPAFLGSVSQGCRRGRKVPVKAIPSSGRCRKRIQSPNTSRAGKVKAEIIFGNKPTCLRVLFFITCFHGNVSKRMIYK